MSPTNVITGRRLALVAMWTAVPALTAACGAASETSAPASREIPAPDTKVEGDAAVWVPAPGSAIESSSTTFTALVSRLGCNDGITGRVHTPEIVSNESEVVVTFTVAAKGPGAANCQGNQEVAYEVDLGEPLLGRALIDGQCLPAGEAVTTSFCVPDSTRYEP